MICLERVSVLSRQLTENLGRESTLTRKQHRFGYPITTTNLNIYFHLDEEPAFHDNGIDNTYALTGLKVNLYRKQASISIM
jgi:hypothetical protein